MKQNQKHNLTKSKKYNLTKSKSKLNKLKNIITIIIKLKNFSVKVNVLIKSKIKSKL